MGCGERKASENAGGMGKKRAPKLPRKGLACFGACSEGKAGIEKKDPMLQWGCIDVV